MMKRTSGTIQKTGLGAKASRRLGNAVVYVILVLITRSGVLPCGNSGTGQLSVAEGVRIG